jgi:tetratricopeptide (TPR) repeat protein/O-antigen ligase
MFNSKIMFQLALALILISSAAISVNSPLNQPLVLQIIFTVIAGAVLSLFVIRRQSLVIKSWFRFPGFALDIALLAWIAAATNQALVAVDLPSPHLPIHDLPGAAPFYLLAAAGLVFLTVRLSVAYQQRGQGWAALLAAALFSSTLYLRSFAVPEAGPVYAAIAAFALISIMSLFSWKDQPGALIKYLRAKILALNWHFWIAAIFLATVFLAVLFSPVPGQSLDAWLHMLILVSLGVLVSVYVSSWRDWQKFAWAILIIAGVIPFFFALLKLGSLVAPFGLVNALAYRLHPTEMGGANLIGRSVAIVAPLALALTAGQSRRYYNFARWIILAGLFFVSLYARSWGGLFATVIGLILYACLANFDYIRRFWWRWRDPVWLRGFVVLSFLIFAIGEVFLAFRVAPQLNVNSYNGRLIHWQGAFYTWQAHPWVGAGLGNETAYTTFSERIGGLIETQETHDNPLAWSQSAIGRSLTTHSHNLFLEFLAGSGLVGFLGFIGFLIVLGWFGLRAWNVTDGKMRLLVAACLGGISAELAWGMQDVSWVTPPFFSFPLWGLVGLIAAANHLSAEEPTLQRGLLQPQKSLAPLYAWLVVLLAVPVVLFASISSYRYASGFVAFQQQRWSDAVSHLLWAAQFHPLDPQLRQLLAESYLAKGDFKQAESQYELLSSLKRDYSPYLSQLGWLAWYHGDAARATYYFEQAVESDPSAAWRSSLHLDLGLAYYAQGLSEEAILQFSRGLTLYPQLAADPRYWRPVQRPDSGYEVILNPVYYRGNHDDLKNHILLQLGVADFTDRQLTPIEWQTDVISLVEVLEAVSVEYRLAHLDESSKAPHLLAAQAQAYHQAGYFLQAERAYLQFQETYPRSAFSYRSLGDLYLSQGFTAEAHALFEQSTQVSPGDFDSRLYLASVAMQKGKHLQSIEELEELTRQSLLRVFRSRLYDPRLYSALARLSLEVGDEDSALEHLSRVEYIRGTPQDSLELARMYISLDQVQQAQVKCIQAARDLLFTWPAAYDPSLWEVAVCLAMSEVSQTDLERLAGQDAFLGNILLGHAVRYLGDFDHALQGYLGAAEARSDQAAPHFFRGETYQAKGDPDQAGRAYRQAAELNPMESLPMLALGRMQWSLGQTQAAMESFKTAVEMTPGWTDAHLALGDALLTLGERQAAAEHMQRAYWLEGLITDRDIYHFPSALPAASVLSPAPQYVRGDFFTVDDQRRYTLFMHPLASASYQVSIPENTTPLAGLRLGPVPGKLASTW